MRPIYQTKFGEEGNCLRAALASIFEVALEDVPDFRDEHGWYGNLIQWARERGYLTILMDGKFRVPADMHYLVWGESPRGFPHSVVGFNDQIVHDPHPEGGGLVKVEDYVIFLKAWIEPEEKQ